MSDKPQVPHGYGDTEKAEYVTSLKAFSDTLTLDLTDEEIKKAFEVCMRSLRKWRPIFAAKLDPHSAVSFSKVEDITDLIMQWDSEIQAQLAAMDLDGEIDIEPLRRDEPPTIVINGALPSHYSAKYGMDHEKKGWEVKRAGNAPVLGAEDIDL